MLDAAKKLKAKLSIIFTQCSGMITATAMQGTILLLYLKALGFSGASIVFLLSFTSLLDGLFSLLGAAWADRYGKKKIGFFGQYFTLISILFFWVAGICPSVWKLPFVVVGLFLYGAGNVLFGGGWLALLFPIIPAPERGKFFATLRMSFQAVGALFGLGCMYLLRGTEQNLAIFYVIFAIGFGAQAIRLWFYNNIPELEPPHPDRKLDFFKNLKLIWAIPRFPSFAIYLFLLFFCVSARMPLFGLVEKEVLLFSDSKITFFSILTQGGSFLGFFCGGWAVSYICTKRVFVAGHLLYVLALFLFVFRGLFGEMETPISISHFLFGFVSAAVSIAIVTERMELLPAEARSMAASLSGVMMSLGLALGSAFNGLLLRLSLFPKKWTFQGLELSDYDAINLAFSVGILLLMFTLLPKPAVRVKLVFPPRRIINS